MIEKLVRCTCPRLGGFDPDCPVSHEKPGAGMSEPKWALEDRADIVARLVFDYEARSVRGTALYHLRAVVKQCMRIAAETDQGGYTSDAIKKEFDL